MVTFKDNDDFRAWLNALPDLQRMEWARVLAARVVLRVLPGVGWLLGDRGFGNSDRQRSRRQNEITLTVSYALAASWVAAQMPSRDAALS